MYMLFWVIAANDSGKLPNQRGSYTATSLLTFVTIPTPNQYNNRKGIPGIKNRNRISKPFGMFI